MSQEWSQMDASDRRNWFMEYGHKIDDARKVFEAAARAYADTIKETGAHEMVNFDPATFTSDTMDRADRSLAPEVQEYLNV